jgi:integrase
MHRGGPLKSVKKAFEKACQRAKLIGVMPHTMKHTYIAWLLRSGVSASQVSGLTATSVATILRVYGHHVKEL